MQIYYIGVFWYEQQSCTKKDEKGIIARSIKEDDFVRFGGNSWLNYRNAFHNDYATYGQQYEIAYTRNNYYPIIYAHENNSVIDNIKKINGIEPSEQEYLLKRTDDGAILGRLKANESIQPYFTYYNTKDYNKTCELLGNYANILLANNFKSQYWIATRCNPLARINSSYRIHCTANGRFDASLMSGSDSPVYNASASLFPIVTIKNNHLEETSTIGTYNVK